MHYAPAYPAVRSDVRSDAPAGFSLTRPLVRIRDWLDERGKPAWIAATVLALVFAWPVGLALVGYTIWSNRMFACRTARTPSAGRTFYGAQPTGNAAFDAYRADTLKRLEDEHAAFLDFLAKLREAKDKAEFDQFMQDRSKP